MKKFRFKFGSVLQLKKVREEEALRQLGVAQRTYQRELTEKARLIANLDSALHRREGLGRTGAVSGLDFQLEQSNIDGVKHRIVRSNQAITRASRAVEKALRAYLNAKKQTRMMETLRERHYGEFKKERARKEQREMDDLVVMRSRLAEEEAA